MFHLRIPHLVSQPVPYKAYARTDLIIYALGSRLKHCSSPFFKVIRSDLFNILLYIEKILTWILLEWSFFTY